MSKKTNAKDTQPVNYNGDAYHNEAFECDADVASALIETGACSLDITAATEKDSPAREQIIADAIAQLKPNSNQFDADGKPAVKALSKITDSVVTVEERDAVWAKVQAAEKPDT